MNITFQFIDLQAEKQEKNRPRSVSEKPCKKTGVLVNFNEEFGE
jgi:hypothetical protein